MFQDRAPATPPAWVVPVMRFGYAARGVTYLLLGGLVLGAALTGGQTDDTQSALATLRGHSFGTPLLWLLAAGFASYALWRGLCAWRDLERRGHDAKGLIARAGQTVSGVIQAGLAVSAARLAMGAGGGGQDSARTLASWLLQQPMGRWLILAVGAVTMAARGYYGIKAFKAKYRAHLRATATTRRLDPALKAGLIAHGLVIALIGSFLLYAGWTADPAQAGGMTDAFETVRAQPYGPALLAVLALGLIGFAIYCAVEARYRVLPARAGTDIPTLAARARARARARITA